MSLINKMLNDLEERQALMGEGRETVLDGLYSAYEVELKDNPDRRKSYIILVLVGLVAVVLLMFVNNLLPDTFFAADTSAVTPSVNAVAVAERGEVASIKGNIVRTPPLDFSLKLDQVLLPTTSAQAGTAIDRPVDNTIASIALAAEGDALLLNFVLPSAPDYRVFALEDPYRAVVELKNLDYQGELPDLTTFNYLIAARKHRDTEGNFRLVLESSRPLAITNTRLVQTEGQEQSQTLQVALAPRAETQSVNSRTVVAEPAVKAPPEVSVRVEASAPGDFVKSAREPVPAAPADKLLYEGLKLNGQGKIAEALDKFYAAVSTDSAHTQARATLAITLFKQGQRDQAYVTLEEGLALHPEIIAWRTLLAQAYFDAGDARAADAALSATQVAIDAAPDFHALHAAVLQKLDRHQEAATLYQHLLKLYPANGIWWMGLAISLEALERDSDAIYAYRTALNGQALTPETHQYITRRIRALSRKASDEAT